MTRAAFRSLRDRIGAYRVRMIVYKNGARIRATHYELFLSRKYIASGDAKVCDVIVGVKNDYVRCVRGKR